MRGKMRRSISCQRAPSVVVSLKQADNTLSTSSGSREDLNVRGHAALLAEAGDLQDVEHRRMRAQAIQRDGEIFGGLVVDFESDVRHLIAADFDFGRFESEQPQHVAHAGQCPGAEPAAGA